MKAINGKTVYTVSEVSKILRQNLEHLSFWIEGEISSFKGLNPHYRYLYFDLKDPYNGFKLPCIAEPQMYEDNDFRLADGQMVLAFCNITLWEREGRLQVYVLKIQDFGKGYLLAKLEELKAKLAKKGYFDPQRKKTLRPYPTNIAVIGSWISDAWQDFKRHSIDFFPIVKITFLDVTVQGKNSAAQIANAIKMADKKDLDAIALIRGGGSIEDLSAFNDEDLSKVIHETKTCIVVGVGHEMDITIASLTADISASTPTDAAKIITADYVNLEEKLKQSRSAILNLLSVQIFSISQTVDVFYAKLSRIRDKFQMIPDNLNFLANSLKIAQQTLIRANSQKLTIYKNILISKWQNLYFQNRQLLLTLAKQIHILSPTRTLKRGYSITYSAQDRIIKDAAVVDVGETLKVQLWRGKLKSKILAKE